MVARTKLPVYPIAESFIHSNLLRLDRTMSRSREHLDTEPEVYEAYRSGEISVEEACEFFGSEWEDVRQLSRVEGILRSQPEPEVGDDELYR